MSKLFLKEKANKDNITSSSSTNNNANRPATRLQNDNYDDMPSLITSSRSNGILKNYISHFRLETLLNAFSKNTFNRKDDRTLMEQLKNDMKQIKTHASDEVNFEIMFKYKKKRK